MSNEEPIRHAPSMSQFLNEQDGNSLREMDENKFEDEIVNYLFSRYKLNRKVRAMFLRDSKLKCGRPRLMLADFQDYYSEFPIYLFCRKFRKTRDESPVHRLFMKFDKRQFTKAFDDTAASMLPGVETYGLVFHWPYLQTAREGGVEERVSAMVLHNRTIAPQHRECYYHWWNDRDSPIYLQPLKSLLATMDRECPPDLWEPDD